MSFISYAQNYEDVMLWRALKHVKNGFYIDVGAWSPDIDSVTRIFYEKNWRGINVEPNPEFYEKYRIRRPEDINLKLAIGDKEGDVVIHFMNNPGLSTAVDEFAKQHESAGWTSNKNKVSLTTLASICKQYVKQGQDIHFLKVDVEGLEEAVLRGNDWVTYRPWIVVVEATLPMTQIESYHEWEMILLNAEYTFAYADGLNRFYVGNEHAELLDSFKYPPNVFDGFILNAHQEAEAKAQQAEAKAQQAEAKAQQAEAKAQQAEAKAQQAESISAQYFIQLQTVYNSKSWRITVPLRFAFALLRNLKSDFIKNRVKILLQHGALYVGGRPKLKSIVASIINLMPGLKSRLVRVVTNGVESSCFPAPSFATDFLFNTRVLPESPVLPEALLLSESDNDYSCWVRLTGHVEGHYSLAIVNRSLAKAMELLCEGRLSFIPYCGRPYAEVPCLPPKEDAMVHDSLRRVVPVDAEVDTISIVHHYPFITDETPAGVRGILFFWEETSVPSVTVRHLNDNFDVVWVAAESVKRSLQNSGCSVPVFVIPIGIDHLITADIEPLGKLRVAEGRHFRFLHVSSAFERKGADVLLAAYLDAFTSDDAVELYIKTFPNPHNKIHSQLEALSAGREKLPKVIIDESPLDDVGMLDLYRSSHTIVLPTRGEGFNLPAAEALAMALPVITTGYSAQVDFCTETTATLVAFHFSNSQSHLRASDSCWVEPDCKDLVLKLRGARERVISNDPTLEKQRQIGLKHVRDTYRWENTARAIMLSAKLIKKIDLSESSPLSVALLSSWDTSCGIAEYSKRLIEPLVKNGKVNLKVYCDDRTKTFSGSVFPCWQMKAGENLSVLSALDKIMVNGGDVLYIQHHSAFFKLSDKFCEKILSMRCLGYSVFLELHSTLPLLREFRPTEFSIDILRQLDRIIVHKPEDLNNLLQLGLVNNVMLLPHGVIKPGVWRGGETVRKNFNIPINAVVLGTFGFALPHKGIDTLVEAIADLGMKIDKPVHLLAINSALDERSEKTISECKELAYRLGVSDKIHWVTQFLPIEECQAMLAASDFIVYPYKHTVESASGAVTIGLSTLKPVLVTPQQIFSDLDGITCRLQGNSASDVSNSVIYLLNHTEVSLGLRSRQLAWLQERDWEQLSQRIYSNIMSIRRGKSTINTKDFGSHE